MRFRSRFSSAITGSFSRRVDVRDGPVLPPGERGLPANLMVGCGDSALKELTLKAWDQKVWDSLPS